MGTMRMEVIEEMSETMSRNRETYVKIYLLAIFIIVPQFLFFVFKNIINTN